MEIKVMHRKNENEFYKTYLFEGENIYHFFETFEDNEDFIKKYNFHTNNNTTDGTVIGVPGELWESDSKNKKGTILFIFFINGYELNFIVLMNSRVYITNKGHTIDKVVI